MSRRAPLLPLAMLALLGAVPARAGFDGGTQSLFSTGAGVRALEKQTERWRRLAGLVDKLLLNES